MSLETNKIAAAVLTAGVVAMLSGFVADLLVHSPTLEEDAYPVVVASDETPAAEPQDTGPASLLPLLADADPANGEKLTRACQACHSFDKGGANKVGPNLYGVVGAVMGHLEGFAYSDAMMAKHEAGDTWTYENLNHFIEDPRGWLPGTKMSYGGMSKVEDRADVVAYLRQQSDSPPPLPTPEEIAAVTPADAGPAASEETAMPAASGESESAVEHVEGGERDDTQEAAVGGSPDIEALIAAADPAEGEKVARKCVACHSFDKGGANKIGPNLYGVPGAPIAHRDDFNYSTTFKEAHEAGGNWTYDKLWAFLHDPRGAMSGTKMTFAGLRKDEEVAAVIAYLRQQADNPPPLQQ